MAKDDDIPHERNETRPDFSKPPPTKKLPKELQDTLDNDEKLWEVLYEGHAPESTDSNVRYAAYATRVRTIMQSAHRYVAYTSDIGESFRPVAHPYIIRSAYGISWAYILGDVANEGYKAYLRNQRVRFPDKYAEKETIPEAPTVPQQLVKRIGAGNAETTKDIGVQPLEAGRVPGIEDYRTVMAQRFMFQALASMGLPAFTIHSVVRYSGRAMKDVKNVRLRTWGPIGLGLAAVPFLPYLFDEPVEKAIEWTFHQAFEAVGGTEAVAGRPVIGQQAQRQIESNTVGAKKDKEL